MYESYKLSVLVALAAHDAACLKPSATLLQCLAV